MEAWLVAGVAMSRRRRTPRSSRPSQGGVVWVGVGRFCGGCVKARRQEVRGSEGETGNLCGEMSTSGCSCTTIPAGRPSRVGVAGLGSGRLRDIKREVGGGVAGVPGGGTEVVRRRAIVGPARGVVEPGGEAPRWRMRASGKYGDGDSGGERHAQSLGCGGGRPRRGETSESDRREAGRCDGGEKPTILAQSRMKATQRLR